MTNQTKDLLAQAECVISKLLDCRGGWGNAAQLFSDAHKTLDAIRASATSAAGQPLTDEQILSMRTFAGDGANVYFDKLAFARAIESAVRAQGDGWLPIESAPKFADDIDIWGAHGRYTNCGWSKATYSDGFGWVYQSGYDCNGPVYELVSNATHWKPLPPPPNAPIVPKSGNKL